VSSKYISLIRHGDYAQRASAPSAYQPFSLTQKGEQQAAKAVFPLQYFAKSHNLKIHPCLYSSSLLRAWQTVDIIRQNLNDSDLAIEEDINLAERCVGSVANLTVDEIERIIELDPRYEKPPSDWKSDSLYCLPFPGAESLMQAGERVAAHLYKIADKLEQNQLAIVVGHGASIRHAAYVLGVLQQSDIRKLSMYHCEPVFFEVPDIVTNSWSHVGGDWKVRQQAEQPD
jgi:2,3-bisphosphoglycerate-dependent phosphoglycerate mutase